jgi:deubiquitinase DESI2
MARVFRMDQHHKAKVIANVYDLNESNDMLLNFGLGLFHSGVQIGGTEYTFASGSGIFTHSPKEAGGAVFRESVVIGEYSGSNAEIEDIISTLRPAFKGDSYNVLSRNCNHFADEFLNRVVGTGLPPHINRLAEIGSYFSCLIPPSMTGEAPVGEEGSGSSSSGGGSSGGSGYRPAVANRNAPTSTPFAGSGQKLGANPNSKH